MTLRPNCSQQGSGDHSRKQRQSLGKQLSTQAWIEKGCSTAPAPAPSKLPPSETEHQGTRLCQLARVPRDVVHHYKWPLGSSHVCTLAFQDTTKDNSAVLFPAAYPLSHDAELSAKHEAPQGLLLKSCICEVNVGANMTYERKTSSRYFVLNHQ